MAKKKNRGKNRLLTRLVLFAAVFAAVLIALLIFLNSQVMVIKNISVVGNRTISAEEVIALSRINTGERYGEKSDAQIRENLERNRYIVYERSTFDYNSRRLTLHINERIGWGVVGAYGLYYVIDETGVVLECTGNQYPDNVAGPSVSGLIETEISNIRPTVGSRLPIQTTRRLDVMGAVLKALDETNMLMRIATLDVTYPDDVKLLTDGGMSIELGDVTNLKTKLIIAQEVLYLREKQGSVLGAKLDVSSGTRAHYIPGERPTPTPVPTATPLPGEEADQ
ncbi:MAG: FtsQ-type POTRA domain-containing protein [Clostridia bacterium]|nr:FtsQ-type POTRA domain-containing protein [Clostridia bacterium]